MLTILRRPRYRRFLERIFLLLFSVAIVSVLFIGLGDTPPTTLDIPELNDDIDHVGFFNNDENNNGFIQFATQYHLAPVLLVHTDPFCCRYLITNTLDDIPDTYRIERDLNDGWYLMER